MITILKKIVILLIVMVLIIFARLIINIYEQSNVDEVRKAGAIVVMGASQWNGQPSQIFKARLDHGFSLYQKNFAPKIILTGGIGKGEKISESQVGKNYLIQKGANEQDIFIEERGRTSWQSLNQILSIFKEQNIHSIILVSDGFHLMRLKKMIHNLNITAYGSPVVESPIQKNKFMEFKYMVREVLVYWLFLIFKV